MIAGSTLLDVYVRVERRMSVEGSLDIPSSGANVHPKPPSKSKHMSSLFHFLHRHLLKNHLLKNLPRPCRLNHLLLDDHLPRPTSASRGDLVRLPHDRCPRPTGRDGSCSRIHFSISTMCVMILSVVRCASNQVFIRDCALLSSFATNTPPKMLHRPGSASVHSSSWCRHTREPAHICVASSTQARFPCVSVHRSEANHVEAAATDQAPRRRPRLTCAQEILQRQLCI